MEWIKKALRGFWRARGFFVVAAALKIISLCWLALSHALNLNQNWYYDFVSTHIAELGDLAAIVAFAGIVYWVVTEVVDNLWAFKLKQDIDNGFRLISDAVATGSAKVSLNYVIRWISNSSEAPEKYKNIAMSALCKCYGSHSEQNGSYLHYLVPNLMDKYAKDSAITLHDCVDEIVIRKIDGIDDLLMWQEVKTYTIKCQIGSGEAVIDTYISARAEQTNLQQIMSNLSVIITVEGHPDPYFSFEEWIKELEGVDFSKSFTKKYGSGSLEYDGKWIVFRYKHELEIDKRETHVRISESSFIRTDERAYGFIVKHPTYNFNLSMRLEGLPGWRIQAPQLGASWYHDGSTDCPKVHQNTAQWVSASIPKWALPGLVAYAEWASD